jgi:sugar lactone lactonase YvrE
MRHPILLCALVITAFAMAGGPASMAAHASETDTPAVIDFESDRWAFRNAQVVEYLGQQCLQGTAYLKDVDFQNGVVEVDVAASGSRCFPGISFRRQDNENGESFYIRPHKSGKSDALQYAPVIQGMSGWQLYNGDGFTASAELPVETWIHIRLEFAGTQARVFLNDETAPSLVVHDLKHGLSKGSVGLIGENGESARFANFRYRIDDSLDFGPAPKIETPEGMIISWELSQPFRVTQINREHPPTAQELPPIQWRGVTAEPPGLVNISRTVKRSGREPDCVIARAILPAPQAQDKKLLFGYSDQISVFLNGQILFSGDSAFRKRDADFLGAVGLYDAVFLNLAPGDNELLFYVTESFGGWGFMAQLEDVGGEAIFEHASLTKQWETAPLFGTPESIVYDAERRLLYVSNYYSTFSASGGEGHEFLSKVDLEGNIQDIGWIKELTRPTGMCIHERKLFAVERGNLVEIDIEAGRITARHPIPDAQFPNDASVDGAGRVYISDSAGSVIYRFADGKMEVWLRDPAIAQPNGLWVDGERLLVGCSGDGCLKAVDLVSKKVSVVTRLGNGAILDGIATDGAGCVILSDWNGRVFRVTSAGRKTELLNTTVPSLNCADLAYVADDRLLVIPTFSGGRLLTYKVAVE